jgi:hypothetical protein
MLTAASNWQVADRGSRQPRDLLPTGSTGRFKAISAEAAAYISLDLALPARSWGWAAVDGGGADASVWAASSLAARAAAGGWAGRR